MALFIDPMSLIPFCTEPWKRFLQVVKSIGLPLDLLGSNSVSAASKPSDFRQVPELLRASG